MIFISNTNTSILYLFNYHSGFLNVTEIEMFTLDSSPKLIRSVK